MDYACSNKVMMACHTVVVCSFSVLCSVQQLASQKRSCFYYRQSLTHSSFLLIFAWESLLLLLSRRHSAWLGFMKNSIYLMMCALYYSKIYAIFSQLMESVLKKKCANCVVLAHFILATKAFWRFMCQCCKFIIPSVTFTLGFWEGTEKRAAAPPHDHNKGHFKFKQITILLYPFGK